MQNWGKHFGRKSFKDTRHIWVSRSPPFGDPTQFHSYHGTLQRSSICPETCRKKCPPNGFCHLLEFVISCQNLCKQPRQSCEELPVQVGARTSRIDMKGYFSCNTGIRGFYCSGA